MKKTNLCAVLLLCAALTACGDAAGKTGNDTAADTAKATGAVTDTTAVETLYADDLGEMDFGGAQFRIRTIENINVHSYVDVQESSADVYDQALFTRNRAVEERFNIVISETIAEDNASLFKNLVLAGDDAFEMGTLRCTDALTFWEDNLIYDISVLPHLDLTKPYWAQKLNESISIGGNQYTVIGDYDINVLDLTFALLFNKQMITDYDFTSPYTMVTDGSWTMDNMLAMMTEVIADINGDGDMTEADRWGYLGDPRMVLPGFWIGAGEMSILKDENDCPYINMNSERFVEVFNRIFEITWDAETRYETQVIDADVPSEHVTIFSENRALFMDVSLFHLQALRNMETDFGIIPYPKYDEAQQEYYSRVSYYWANVVPTTNVNLDMTGAVLEALNSMSSSTVVPAYYEIALKTKYSRDEESAAMLDLIFDNRVVDIGDTILCADIRDNFIREMFENNKRDLASQLAKKEKAINKIFEKMPIWD
ncbi:MAG: hypothetical protein IJ302_02305 [Clostridia bacterium]|nr:hypothetical protein [Clostridia bacterium]